MTTDLDLLAQFSRNHSQDAFTELVNRHVNLVYSTALRQVRSPQLAEEVAQSVFADLARRAGQLKSDTVLTAWLYQVARRTAIDVVRHESRRQLREQISVEMNTMNATATDWTHIEPLLDEAMDVLDDTDRTAILLRYFENKSLRDVGQTLGTSEDTAQKRVARALDKLREYLAQHGIATTASALTMTLSTNAIQAAPAILATTISTVALLAGTPLATTAATATAIKTIAMTTLQKTIITATVVVLAGAGIYETRQASILRTRVQALQQQPSSLTGQLQQLQHERDEATNQLAALRDENERLNRNTAELLKLRGQVNGLKSALASVQQQNPPMISNSNPVSGPTVIIFPSNQVFNLDSARISMGAMRSAPPVNLAFRNVNELQNAGNTTVAAGAETALWEVLKNDGRSFGQIAYHPPQSPEDSQSKLFGHLAVELSGASQVAFLPPTAMGEDHSLVNFTASWPAAGDAPPKSTTGSLGFHRVDDHWYLEQFTPQSQAIMLNARPPAPQ